MIPNYLGNLVSTEVAVVYRDGGQKRRTTPTTVHFKEPLLQRNTNVSSLVSNLVKNDLTPLAGDCLTFYSEGTYSLHDGL